MKFNVSYVRNTIPQTILVEAKTAELAESYFNSQKQDAQVYGVHEATADDYRPGKPVMVVPDDYVCESDDVSLEERLASATSRSEAFGKGETSKDEFEKE